MLEKILKSLSYKEVILFGVGSGLKNALSCLNELDTKVAFLSDNNVTLHNTKIKNIEVINPDKLKMMKLPILIISMYSYDISKQLQSLNVQNFYDFSFSFDLERWKNHFDNHLIKKNEQNIQKLKMILKDDYSKDVFSGLINYRKTLNPTYIQQAKFPDYFHPLVQPASGDTIIDAGAWHGDSCVDFAERLSNKCKIYAFEPEKNNFNELIKTIKEKSISNIVHPMPYGLWDKKTTFSFNVSTEHTMQFRIDESANSEIKINVISLDEFAQKNSILKIDFIKMDIEGTEYQALIGAKKILLEQKPKLAICIYHKFDDLWSIPLLIKKLNPDYKLYIGHHSQHLFDTVIYAI